MLCTQERIIGMHHSKKKKLLDEGSRNW